jgi:hypothetical protein
MSFTETQEAVNDVKLVRWFSFKTIVINLRNIAENEGDNFKTMLSEVPFSTQLSIKE